MKRVYIIYHYPCPDGALAALAVWFHEPNAIFFPHSTTVPLVIPPDNQDRHTEVYVLDYCGPSGWLAECVKRFKTVHLIDHHESAREFLSNPGLKTFFDLNHSGCMLAYKYCPTPITPELMRIFQYVEDNDIWKHALPHSREFTAGLRNECYDWDFATYPELLESMQLLDFDHLVASGRMVLARQAELIAGYLAKSQQLFINEIYPVQYVEINSYDSAIISQLGHDLAEKSGLNAVKCGIGAVGIARDDGTYKISIRGFNCVRISSFYNGGGHDGAAGFVLPGDPLKVWSK
jgi:oligoribonuclease NrnB/cAMP/cGMP phosphodiesterase (DHH superfamily)